MLDLDTLMHKYRSDPKFHNLVYLLERMIREHGFMPSELREACFFAQYMYEMTHPKPIMVADQEWEEIQRRRDAYGKT